MGSRWRWQGSGGSDGRVEGVGRNTKEYKECKGLQTPRELMVLVRLSGFAMLTILLK